MKRALILLIFTNVFFSYSQGEVFEFKDTVPGKKLEKLAVISGTYIVLNVKGSPEELYQKTLDWVASTWNKIDDVLLTGPNNSFIKIQGTANGLLTARSAIRQSIPARYKLTFKFKQDKIKMEVTSLEYYAEPTKYTNWVGGWYERDQIHIIDKKGKPYKHGIKEVTLLEAYFNDLATLLKNYSIEESDDGW